MANITWNEYYLVITTALFLYYAWVLFIFYAKDILSIFKPGSEGLQPLSGKGSLEEPATAAKLKQEIFDVIKEAANHAVPREEILTRLKRAIQNSEALPAGMQNSLKDFIGLECKNNCAVILSEEELEMLL